MTTRAQRAAMTFGVGVEQVPDRLWRFAGAAGPGTGVGHRVLAGLLDFLETAPEGTSGMELRSFTSPWSQVRRGRMSVSAAAEMVRAQIDYMLGLLTNKELRQAATDFAVPYASVVEGVEHVLEIQERARVRADYGLRLPWMLMTSEPGIDDGMAAQAAIDQVDALLTDPVDTWTTAQRYGLETALLLTMMSLAADFIEATAQPAASRLLWQAADGPHLCARVRIPGATEMVQARVHGTHVSHGPRQVPLWGTQRINWRWSWTLGWPDPHGRFITFDSGCVGSRDAAVWRSECVMAELRLHAAQVRQHHSGRLLVPRRPGIPKESDSARRHVNLQQLLDVLVAAYEPQLRGEPDLVGGWGTLPHAAEDGTPNSMLAALFRLLNAPVPVKGEPAADVPVEDPLFTAFLAEHAVRLTEWARVYLGGLPDGGPGPQPLGMRHAAGMRAVLVRVHDNLDAQERLADELGPPPDGTDWRNLLSPEQLARHLRYQAPEIGPDRVRGIGVIAMARVRRSIGTAVTQAVRAGYTRWHEGRGESAFAVGAPAFQAGTDPAGHDPWSVPHVPDAVVSLRTGDVPEVSFSYKTEYGVEPFWNMKVPLHWGSRIAAKGWAVIAGRPVTDVLAWDMSGRPARVRTVEIKAVFDPCMHGWCAQADNVVRSIDWSDPEEPRMTSQAGEEGPCTW